MNSHTGKNHQSTFGVPCTVNRACENTVAQGSIRARSGLVWTLTRSILGVTTQPPGRRWKTKTGSPTLTEWGRGTGTSSTRSEFQRQEHRAVVVQSVMRRCSPSLGSFYCEVHHCYRTISDSGLYTILLFQWMRIVVLAWEQQSCVPPSLLEHSLLSHSNSQLSFTGRQSLSKN